MIDTSAHESHLKKKRKHKQSKNISEDSSENQIIKIKERKRKSIKRKSQESRTSDTLNKNSLLKKKRVKATADETEIKNINDTTMEEGSEEVPKPLSKRKQKKEKFEQKTIAKKETTRKETAEKALNYVSKWKYAKSEWKFEKLKQIWLIDHLLDEKSIPEAIFPTVLEYFIGCKGIAREQLLKKGMSVIKKVEETAESNENSIESTDYKRARQLLQALPSDV